MDNEIITNPAPAISLSSSRQRVQAVYADFSIFLKVEACRVKPQRTLTSANMFNPYPARGKEVPVRRGNAARFSLYFPPEVDVRGLVKGESKRLAQDCIVTASMHA